MDLLDDIRIDKEKELNKEYLKSYDNQNSKTRYSYSRCKNSIKTRVDSIHLSVDKVLSMEKIEIDKLRFAAYNEGKSFSVAKNPSELDYKLMNLIFDSKNIGMFFSNKKSSSISVMKPKTFYAQKQYSDNYYMPITLKDIRKRKVIGRTIEDCDIEGEVHKVGGAVSYITSDRGNVNAVKALMFDIDFHSENEDIKSSDIDALCRSFSFFAQEEGVDPTAIINSGRGFQVVYVLKKPVYRNSKNIDNLIKTTYRVFKNIINNNILPEIDSKVELKCDKAINPINQKMRMPGTLNFKSYTYSHVVYFNQNNLYNLGEFLSEKLGDYDEYLEIKQLKKDKKEEKKKNNKHKGNNGNGRNNIVIVLNKRIRDIKSAMTLCSNEMGKGFRNNGYLVLVWQMINLAQYTKVTDEKIADEIFNFDEVSGCSYFRSIEKARSFVESVRGTMDNSQNIFLKNSTIESACTALVSARDMGMEFEIFFKETVESKRDKKREFKEELKENRLKNLKKKVLNGKSVIIIAKETDVCRNTIYTYIREILTKKGIDLNRLNRDILLVLKAVLIEELLKSKIEDNKFILSAPSIYILFNTEKVNKEISKEKLEEFLEVFLKKKRKKNEKNENFEAC